MSKTYTQKDLSYPRAKTTAVMRASSAVCPSRCPTSARKSWSASSAIASAPMTSACCGRRLSGRSISRRTWGP